MDSVDGLVVPSSADIPKDSPPSDSDANAGADTGAGEGAGIGTEEGENVNEWSVLRLSPPDDEVVDADANVKAGSSSASEDPSNPPPLRTHEEG